MPDVVTGFSGAYRFLSNFYPSAVRLDGVEYPTVEHAFQAAKTLDHTVRQAFASVTTPGAAKRMGQTLARREGWEDLKLGIMTYLLRQKFATGPLRSALLATGDMQLIEGNTWGDVYWGVCRGVGQNHLGKLLMQVRSELRGA